MEEAGMSGTTDGGREPGQVVETVNGFAITYGRDQDGRDLYVVETQARDPFREIERAREHARTRRRCGG